MPGSSGSLMPFLRRLPALQSGQKAAAVNLGIFPDSGDARLASIAVPQPYAAAPTFVGSVTTNRLAGIDQLLHQPAPTPAAQPRVSRSYAQPQLVAYAAPVRRIQAPAPAVKHKIWLQLASGPNAAALQGQFRDIKSRNRELFDGIPGYVAKGADRARLVIGPFRSVTDADTFAEDLQTVDVSAFKWSNSESDQIVPLGTE
jgi:hypothetical protein